MRARGTIAAALAFGIAQTITSCRAIEGLGDFHFDGGAGGAGGTGGAGSTGSAAGFEDCTNGIDDNGDGLIDCADPYCATVGYACVGAAPAGWIGPLAFHEGPDGALPACALPYPQAAFQGGSAPQGAPATCEPCTCAPPAAACSGVNLKLFGSWSCSSTMGNVTLSPGACSPLGQSAASVKAGPSVPTAGACSPGGGAAKAPPLTWSSVALACGGAALGGGCANRDVCAPSAPAPFSATRCIAQAGDRSCPAAYPLKHALVEAAEQRGCSACACDVVACAANTQLFDDTACQSLVGAPISTGTCAQATSAAAALVTVAASCPASGGAPAGAIQASPWTLCCTP